MMSSSRNGSFPRKIERSCTVLLFRTQLAVSWYCLVLFVTAVVGAVSESSSLPRATTGNLEYSLASASYDHIPWQPSPTAAANSLQSIDEATRYEDLPPTIFSPSGRLHPVEAAVKASKLNTPLANSLVALKCKNGIIILSTLPISPHLDAREEVIFSSNHTSNDQFENENSITTANETLRYPSLFLFEETCAERGPIFEIHPSAVGATAGNAVDNRILGEKLMALGMAKAMEEDSEHASTTIADRIAKDLANQLQIATQDVGEAQKLKLGRMLASSAVILGGRNQKLWRIDPTGQFWDCQAVILGPNADQTEVAFYRLLQQECERQDAESVQAILKNMSTTQALEMVRDFLQDRIISSSKPWNDPPTKEKSLPIKARAAQDDSISSSTNETSSFESHIYWQALILDYSFLTRKGRPTRISKKGTFAVRGLK